MDEMKIWPLPKNIFCRNFINGKNSVMLEIDEISFVIFVPLFLIGLIQRNEHELIFLPSVHSSLWCIGTKSTNLIEKFPWKTLKFPGNAHFWNQFKIQSFVWAAAVKDLFLFCVNILGVFFFCFFLFSRSTFQIRKNLRHRGSNF